MVKSENRPFRGEMPPRFINDVIRYVMATGRITQREMAVAIGAKSANTVSARLNIDNMTFDRAIEMLDVCGYEVVVQRKQTGARPDGQFVVCRSDVERGGASE